MKNKKVALLILDGWGIGDKSHSDAIWNAKTPVMDELLKHWPHATLKTSGLDVGLPDGQMGNSEVGHINIGAGRVIYQELVRINNAIQQNELKDNEVLQNTFRYVKENKKRLHLMGLVSDGCIHSSIEHLEYLVDLAENNQIEEIYVHAFTDGRDTDPKSGIRFIERLENHIQHKKAKLASVIGRYYAMDRDKRWERVKLAWDMLVNGIGEPSSSLSASLLKRYQEGETDEFIKPLVYSGLDGRVLPGDAVISFNYRTDRCREITEVLTQTNLAEFGMHTVDIRYVTMTNYDDSYKNVHVIFHKDEMSMTLGEVISEAGKTQVRIAETEKYPHVTFFFSGGREMPFKGESRIMIESPKVSTYDLKPEMSANEITDAVIELIQTNSPDFICLNWANPDMVGHTGVYEAIVKAVETVDACLGRTIEALLQHNYSALIIADHGNADFAVNPDGSPNTAHTVNLVPLVLLDKDYKTIESGKLADVAPTILTLMKIKIPTQMSGNCLI
jgi:2,3-bisphosphoglycerate-independent phosphoglycerate mutase